MNKYLSAAEKADELLSGCFNDSDQVLLNVKKKIEYLQFWGEKYRLEIGFWVDVLWCLETEINNRNNNGAWLQ
jgi:hypothetical protein